MTGPFLNIGCGTIRPGDPWVNADPYPEDSHTGPVVVADPLRGLPWPDGFFAGAVAHHVLMMVPWVDLPRWITEVRRVTAGPLRVSVPNIEGAIQGWESGDRGAFPTIGADQALTVDDAFCLYVTQGGATRSIFTWPRLTDLLKANYGPVVHGHDAPTSVYGLDALDSRHDESWIAEAL